MNYTSAAANDSSSNASGSSMNVLFKAEGIAWCTALMLASVFIVVGNLLTIIVFVGNKTFRRKSLFLVINMAFADLMLGTISLPFYIYIIGVTSFQLWTGRINMPLLFFYTIVDTIFLQASTISAVLMSVERFYAIYWPLKHRTLSTRAYRNVILIAWTLALLISATYIALLSFTSKKHVIYTWIPYALTITTIICGCNIGIWRKFKHGSLASQRRNRASQNQRLTKTLLFVSVLALLCWLPLSIVIIFIVPADRNNISSGTLTIYYFAVLLNYSNSFINPIVFVLRIPEFKQTLGLCCFRTRTTINMKSIERRTNRAIALSLTQLSTIEVDPTCSNLQLAFEQEVMDTKL